MSPPGWLSSRSMMVSFKELCLRTENIQGAKLRNVKYTNNETWRHYILSESRVSYPTAHPGNVHYFTTFNSLTDHRLSIQLPPTFYSQKTSHSNTPFRKRLQEPVNSKKFNFRTTHSVSSSPTGVPSLLDIISFFVPPTVPPFPSFEALNS